MHPVTTLTDKFERRDFAILRHTADYGVALNAVLSRLFFAGKQCGQIVRRLADDGDLELFPRALPGGISYARLTKSGCARIGVSEKLSRPLSGHALSQAISIACYCGLASRRRYRLRHVDLKALYGDKLAPPANVPHVLVSSAELGQLATLRVHFATGTAHETMKQLKRRIEDAEKNPAFKDALGPDGSYGFLLLSPTEAGKRALEQALARSALHEETLVVAEMAPGAEQLAAFLRSLKGAAA
jgi:hypothetical protein